MSGKAAIVFRGMPLLCKLVASERRKLCVPTPLSDKVSQTGLSFWSTACLVMCPAVVVTGRAHLHEAGWRHAAPLPGRDVSLLPWLFWSGSGSA
jgi:hypothetical protein